MPRLFLVTALLISFCSPAQNFIATIDYGHKVPVFTWAGDASTKTGAALIDDCCKKSDSLQQAQGMLIILGRDNRSVWYMVSGYSNDASEEAYYIRLMRTDTSNVTTVIGEIDSVPRPFAHSFHKCFDPLFNSNKLDQLLPVTSFSPPREYDWVAQVNSKELNRCFQFNLNVIDDPDDGSCVFYFEWDVTAMPWHGTREVSFYDFYFDIPLDWKYQRNADGSGFIANGTDTMRFRECYCLFPPMGDTMKLPAKKDSAEYARVRALNARRIADYPYQRRIDACCGGLKTELRYPLPGYSGYVMMHVEINGPLQLTLQSTKLKPEDQAEFISVARSAR